MSEACINCHRIRGLPEGLVAVREKQPGMRFGPDLTHLASRQTLASGMIANTPENLKKWVSDPQQIKQDCWMPAMKLSKEDINLVVEYLGALR
jgi:cytochrome c oxidase subunit II